MKSGAPPAHVAGGGRGSPPSFSQKSPWPAPLLPRSDRSAEEAQGEESLIHFLPYSLCLPVSVRKRTGGPCQAREAPPCPLHMGPPRFICVLLQWRPSSTAQALTGRAGRRPLGGSEVWTGVRSNWNRPSLAQCQCIQDPRASPGGRGFHREGTRHSPGTAPLPAGAAAAPPPRRLPSCF